MTGEAIETGLDRGGRDDTLSTLGARAAELVGKKPRTPRPSTLTLCSHYSWLAVSSTADVLSGPCIMALPYAGLSSSLPFHCR